MSSHRELIIVRRAQRDLAGIRAHTRNVWGSVQADEYDQEMARAIEAIAANPEIGVGRDDLGPAIRVMTVKSHRIIYRLSDQFIRVLRVIHVRQDVQQSAL